MEASSQGRHAWPLPWRPGLNTLASHGYLPRDGVAIPAQLIQAVQEGFNMENGIARFVTYAAHLVDGNLVTDLFADFSKRYGGGLYNMTVAAELRYHRIQESIATNPQFDSRLLRFSTAYAEATFPCTFFVDGRISNRTTAGWDVTNTTLFFRDSEFPHDFWRAPFPTDPIGFNEIAQTHPMVPGRNVQGINSFTHDPSSADLADLCLIYNHLANVVVRGLYPNPKGVSKKNLIINSGHLYSGTPKQSGCEEVFPYGKL
ncbi:hypothetical protein FA13DRAFT_1800796 [Coprinellus micaceus]|uniref:Heme haloperoxidase family profile domain-containing protein n=1 Tax=Coprinellus micaceus TaxID=71717 RepID=A0A4Y7SFY5_COPMI|nr:hypothetical protein FA13DRAFT_1800796 [Coprinellus micaceus]